MPPYLHTNSRLAEMQTLIKRMRMSIITAGQGRTKSVVFAEIIDLYRTRLNWLRQHGQREGFNLRGGVRHRRG